MASDSLFLALANAKSQPSKALRAVESAGQAGQDILGGYLQGNQIAAAKSAARLKPYEIYTTIADKVGPERANAIFKQAGMDAPTIPDDTGLGVNTPPEKLIGQGGYGERILKGQNTVGEMRKRDLETQNIGPREPASVKSNLIQAGLAPDAADAWLSVNTDQTGKVPNRNYDDLIKGLGAKNQGARGQFYQGSITGKQIADLPSRSNPNTAAGAAYQVKVAARQGKSLIAKATTPQNLQLASNDLARAIQRATPTSETIGASNYAQSLPTLLSQFQQKLTSDPNGPDVPKLRKQLYDTFDELDKAATPWIVNHLSTMEASGFTPPNWGQIKQNELGLNIPDIPFDASGGGGKTYQKTAKNAQGVTIGTNDNWATYEPVQGGQ